MINECDDPEFRRAVNKFWRDNPISETYILKESNMSDVQTAELIYKQALKNIANGVKFPCLAATEVLELTRISPVGRKKINLLSFPW